MEKILDNITGKMQKAFADAGTQAVYVPGNKFHM